MHKLYLAVIGFCLLFSSCNSDDRTAKNIPLDTIRMANHIRTLASDSFLGRKPFTKGETKTLEYIEGQFKKFGLEPGNADSYFQEVSLVELTPTVTSPLEITSASGKKVSFEVVKDYVAYSERVAESLSLESSEVVFAGYGIVAPEYDWNDYEGLDVEGKTVVVLINDPGFGIGDSTFFKGQTMTYYGRWTYKYEEAARQGAAGVFIVHETAPAGYPWLVVGNSWTGARLYLDQKAGSYKPIIQGWLTRDAALRIFDLSEVDMRGFAEKARSGQFKPVSLNVQASVALEVAIKRDVSQNVIAKVTGTTRPDECIIYTAHWDHLGVGQPVDGDSIYNGAHDNASGVAAVLEIARAFMGLEQKPERTVVFLTVTAEEQGLLGSKFYAENPIYPVEKTVANINIDGLNYFGRMKDFTVVGYGHSELDDLAGKIAQTQGRYVMPDPEPGKGYFFRSDHFHFARVGIPAMFASGTYEHMTRGVDYIAERSNDYLTNKYHRPADEYNPDEWNYGGMLQDTELYYRLGLQLANSEEWPKWKAGSEFKSIREGN